MITIITATYNIVASGRAEMLERCVRSVASISAAHEHLIIDGASNDGTVELLERLASSHKGVTYISEPDTGIYNAFNKGVARARGEWIYFIGSDDYIFAPAVFDEVAGELNDDCDMVVSPVRHSDGSKLFLDRRLFRNILIIKHYCHQGVIMKKSLIERLGGFDESYKIAADFKICLSAHLENFRCKVIWKEYAEFSIETGMSHYATETEFKERIRVPSELFGLNSDEIDFLTRYQLVPVRIILKLLMHCNKIIRYAAQHALKRRIAHAIGLL